MKKLFAFLVMSVVSLSAAHAEVDNPFGTGSATSTAQSTVTTPVKKATTSHKTTIKSKSKSSLGGSCGSYPRTCGQMKSCAQAREALKCGNTRLDRDHDGIPCESICGG
ncbi:excalibur calcium-binding domain-containing protein [Acinetobacter sp. ANC 4636]